MSERVVVSVDPGADDASQKVQEVFLRVLDLFDLLVQSDDAPQDAIAWRLVRVSMNSPLTVVAEAIAVRPDPIIQVDRIARAQVASFASNLQEIKRGRVPRSWSDAKGIKRVERALGAGRSGRTRVELSPELSAKGAPLVVEVTPGDVVAIESAVRAATEAATSVKPKDQRGSIEGQLLEVGLHYNKPALLVRERRTQAEVWCVVTDEHRQEIANDATFEDVWQGRRVRVEGVLLHDASGDVSRVIASHVHVIAGTTVPTDAILAPDFTDGLSTAEYLERHREGLLG